MLATVIVPNSHRGANLSFEAFQSRLDEYVEQLASSLRQYRIYLSGRDQVTARQRFTAELPDIDDGVCEIEFDLRAQRTRNDMYSEAIGNAIRMRFFETLADGLLKINTDPLA